MARCHYCQTSLSGKRRDALYCSDSHRAMDSKRRREARIRHEAMRDLAKRLDPSGEILAALDRLDEDVPDFPTLNSSALDSARKETS